MGKSTALLKLEAENERLQMLVSSSEKDHEKQASRIKTLTDSLRKAEEKNRDWENQNRDLSNKIKIDRLKHASELLGLKQFIDVMQGAHTHRQKELFAYMAMEVLNKKADSILEELKSELSDSLPF